MKLLWVCNKCPGPIAEISGVAGDCFGGWLDESCRELMLNEDIEFNVLFRHKIIVSGCVPGVRYASFADEETFDYDGFLSELQPDVIHIWGTEFKHSYYLIRNAEKAGIAERCIISIQGLVSIYGRYHYSEGLPVNVIQKKKLRDYLRPSNIIYGRNQFLERGQYEIQAIQRCQHIIGRTDWDKAISKQYNPGRKYYLCNESLRDCFYTGRWNLDQVQKHSIFVSQSSYPVKGFHYAIEALHILSSFYPDAEVYTTGKNLFSMHLVDKLKMNSYQEYLLHLIKEYGLEQRIHFLGQLSAEEMKEQYLKAHVYVSPSTIENSQNSLGEAMLLGCPSVSSDVGGVKNMMEHGREGFIYQSSAPYMCAYYICQIFENDETAKIFSENARKHASFIFDRERNFNKLMEIYHEVLPLH